VGGGLVVASTPGAILAHPACPPDLDPAVLGATAAGMVCSAGPQTVFRAISALPAGHQLLWRSGCERAPERFWHPEVATAGSGTFSGAAEHLRHLLQDAAKERLDPAGTTTAWMSGGWDSTAVLAAGRSATGGAEPLQPVSISYPRGDPGREDDLIQAVASFCNLQPHWLKADAIPLVDAAEAWAASRDEPFAHLYERWNRALAQGSRASGSRVALDGNGGDQLFQVSDVFMADLFRQGRWWSLRKEWRGRKGRSTANLLKWVLLPSVSDTAVRSLAALRGRPVPRRYLERLPPRWIRRDFCLEHHLRDRERAALPPDWPGRRAQAEMYWYLTAPVFSRASAAVASFALEEGVELRSPLHDRAVAEFAATRPREERSSGPETKRLLRAAMHGLLPAEFLAPRPHRTGLTRAYSTRAMLRAFPAWRAVFSQPLLLAELGIIDPVSLRASFESFLTHGQSPARVELFHTLQTELWLRHRAESPSSPGRTTAASAGPPLPRS
jgi:asparagine synthase (glutamine-hydrolysing)